MRGTRAGILTALLSRAPAAHVEFRPLQALIWQIEGGLSYDEMPPQSKQLIDQIAPDYKKELRADFLTQLQGNCGKVGRIFPGLAGLCGPVNALALDYQRIHQTLIQNENNYQALAQQFVHVIPGKAPYVGPTYWSQISPRIYERLVGGAVYGEMARLEVRVLPTSGIDHANNGGREALEKVSYAPSNGQDLNSTTLAGPVRVPVCSAIAYPNQTASQVLGCEAQSGPTVQLDTPAVNGLSVTINGTATPGTSGAAIKQISWNWGDGTPAQIGGFPESHAYPAAGAYAITVTVSDSNGDTGSAEVSALTESAATAGIWITRANASSEAGSAGRIQLNWILPHAAVCLLGVVPQLAALPIPSPVACELTQSGMLLTLPPVSGGSPAKYVFTLSAQGNSSVAPVSVSIFVLPTITFGPFGQKFTSISYTQVLPLKSCDQSINILGCWGEFGLTAGGPVASMALSDGIAMAGIVGYNYIAGGDADLVNADYNPLSGVPGETGYSEYLNVHAQEDLVAFGECSLGGPVTPQEGGAGLSSYIVALDSVGDSYSGNLAPNYCANLLTPNLALDEFEADVESAYNAGESIGTLPQNVAFLSDSVISIARSVLQPNDVPSELVSAISYLLQVISASPLSHLAGNVGVTSSSATQDWQPILPRGGGITLSSGLATVAAEVGFGTVGELSATISSVTVSGLAVPSDPPSWLHAGAETVRPPVESAFPRGRRPTHSQARSSPRVSARRLAAQSARVTWEPPARQTVRGYRIIWGRKGGRQVHSMALGPTADGQTIHGLAGGSPYVIAVAAKTDFGLEFLSCVVLGVSPGSLGAPCSRLPVGPNHLPWSTTNHAEATKVAIHGVWGLNLTIAPLIIVTGASATIAGTVQNSGGPLSGVKLSLTATQKVTQARLVTVTTASDGSFRLIFTAPRTPGVVTITAQIAGVVNSPVAKTTLRVVSKR